MINQVGVADTEEQASLVEAVTGVLSRHWPTDERNSRLADPAAVSELPVWEALAELGVAGLPLAEEHGGAGGCWADLAVALEAVGAALAPVPVVATAAALGTLQAVAGKAATKLLRAVAGGATVATVAWTAREDLWGVPGTVTAAPPATQDDTAGVSGDASVVLSPEAATILVLADLPAGDGCLPGPLLVAVDAGGAGVGIERAASMDATRPLGVLTLRGATGTVLAAGDEAVAAVRRGQVTAAAALSAELTGIAGHCLTGAVRYATDRHQFDRPIGSFQAIKHRCAEMLAETEQARAASRHLAALLDADAGLAELEDAAALALLAAGRAAHTVANEYLQVLGGIGFTWEHEVHLYVRRAVAMAPLFGGSAAHRRRLDPTRRGGGGGGGGGMWGGAGGRGGGWGGRGPPPASTRPGAGPVPGPG
ncbi:MAG: acyl-CoA dehydrogenase family protein [Frankia sp.]|nr:acyl-CoA dehydrogenase family protein [Frankia sp.]